jgi:Fe-S-cluster-containing hydrogenase component 2
MEALSLVDDVVSLTESYCIGCGNCVPVCPSGALRMVRHADIKPVELKFDFPGLGL